MTRSVSTLPWTGLIVGLSSAFNQSTVTYHIHIVRVKCLAEDALTPDRGRTSTGQSGVQSNKRDLTQNTTATATRTSPYKGLN